MSIERPLLSIHSYSNFTTIIKFKKEKVKHLRFSKCESVYTHGYIYACMCLYISLISICLCVHHASWCNLCYHLRIGLGLYVHHQACYWSHYRIFKLIVLLWHPPHFITDLIVWLLAWMQLKFSPTSSWLSLMSYYLSPPSS